MGSASSASPALSGSPHAAPTAPVPAAEQRTHVFCIGVGGSGKSSFLWRLENREAAWGEATPPLSAAIDFKRIKCGCGGDAVDMMLWDMGGRERTRVLFGHQLRKASRSRAAGQPVVFLVFAADMPGLEEAKHVLDTSLSLEPQIAFVPKILLATKQDSCDAPALSDIGACAASFGEGWTNVPPIAVSAKTGCGIDEAMTELARVTKRAMRSEESAQPAESEELCSQLPSFWGRLRKFWTFRAMELLL